jgi:hypothetical protein
MSGRHISRARRHLCRPRLRVIDGTRGPDSDFLTDFRVARGLTQDSVGSVPLGDMSPPRTWLEGLDLIGAWS